MSGIPAYIFAYNHRPAEDPHGEVLIVQEVDGEIELTLRSKSREQKLTRHDRSVVVHTIVGPTAHITLDRTLAIDLAKRILEWAAR